MDKKNVKFINALGVSLMNVTDPLVKLLKEHQAALLVVALTAVAATQENEQLSNMLRQLGNAIPYISAAKFAQRRTRKKGSRYLRRS